jgi:hypothetical protein
MVELAVNFGMISVLVISLIVIRRTGDVAEGSRRRSPRR